MVSLISRQEKNIIFDGKDDYIVNIYINLTSKENKVIAVALLLLTK